ncbi:hypothetical protein SLS60_000611 [Paraconiothyrium brasiliense]|uniref:N-acetyltransferase domain-containing protein n=1 Tax=Paraconiothyrium brasiliense TaxID=300254 RepID=A0ABR3S6Q3_9PLEO
MASDTSKPSNPRSNLQLRTAQLSDLPAMARVWHAAFFDDEIIGELMHPNRKEHPEDVYWFLLRGLRERFWDWRHQFVLVTVQEDGKEKIAGAADWRRLGEGGRRRELANVDPRNLISPALNVYHSLSLRLFPNRAADPKNAEWLTAAVANSEKYWTGDRAECWDLHVCGVHPDFQGKGVGKLLVQWGVEQAKSEGDNVVASVLCGEKNRGFYGKGGLTVQVGGSENGIALFTK